MGGLAGRGSGGSRWAEGPRRGESGIRAAGRHRERIAPTRMAPGRMVRANAAQRSGGAPFPLGDWSSPRFVVVVITRAAPPPITRRVSPGVSTRNAAASA